MFWSNIGLIGGNTKFPGFRQRLYVLSAAFLGPMSSTVILSGCSNYNPSFLWTVRSGSANVKSESSTP